MPCRAQLSASEKVSAEKTKITSQALLRGVAQVSNADAGHLGNATVLCTGDGSTWNSIEEINSDKSIDSGRPSLALRSISCRSGVQDPEVGSSYVDRSLEHNSSLVVCSSSDLEAKAVILIKGLIIICSDAEGEWLEPMILSLLQRSSWDADREHHNSNPPVTDSNDVEDVLPNHISFSEELRLQGLGKWLQHCRVMLHHVAGTPERAWLLFSLIFILETVVVAIFRPKTIKLLNATHQQERNFMWEEVKSYREMNMLLNYEINMLKRKVDTLDEDFLMKEGQNTILKDSIGKPFDLLASPASLLE
ncbi:hypothetical protein CQW23_31406 [Capsicum baccatum]|uniref:Uncharacterized protein n=1 Tax=Capsicum baccatum TaxID=33114 RepID=A0A2G2V7J7_CAPBA|nr:hypothetical protein CQW23_31406 [Capsicum baccatum]